MNVASFFNSKIIKPVAEAPIASKSPLVAPALVALLDIAGPSYFPVPANLIAFVSVEDPLNCISTDPDNAHLHQLFFLFILRKFRITNKLIANNLTSLIINLYHFCVFFIGLQNLDQTNAQLLLIAINLVVYICLYIFLSKFSKTLQ